MIVRKVRTYFVDPRYRKERIYVFRAERSKTIVGYDGRPRKARDQAYGDTPRRAIVNLRKHAKRRDTTEVRNHQDWVVERRMAEKWERERTPTIASRRRVQEWLRAKQKEGSKDDYVRA